MEIFPDFLTVGRRGDNKLTYRGNPNNSEEIEEVMIPTDSVKGKLYEEVNSVLPDENFEVLDGEVSDEERDKIIITMLLIVMLPTF